MKIDISHYGLYLTSYNVGVDALTTTVTFVMQATDTDPKLEEFSRDVSVLNAIRGNNDPAVRDQWEALLTTIALTSDRNVPDVTDNMASIQPCGQQK